MTKKRGTYLPPEATVCDWCGQWTRLVHVHGNYQCGSCRRVLIEQYKGEEKMADSSSFTAHFTVYISTSALTEEEAKRFPVEVLKALHHVQGGLKVSIVRESNEDPAVEWGK
jgi:hypothetical protein